jgi:hypothetical protein
MGKTRDTGFLNNCVFTDSSNNVGIGGAANASFKLQVTGTTNLTGALSGTSATFSGALTSGAVATFTAAANPLILKSTSATTMYTEYYYNTSTLSGYIGSGSGILTGANNSDFIVRSEADFVVATGNNRRLTIASTGAATFSSNVNATGTITMNKSGGYGILAQDNGNNAAANGAYIGWTNAANTRYFIGQLDTNNDLNYHYFNGSSWLTSIMKFSNAGAATFASSVTATAFGGAFSITAQGAGANGISDGPFIRYINTTNSYQILKQINTATDEDIWSYRGSWNKIGTLNGVSGVYTALSDINKKKDFEDSTIGLNAILNLKPTLYRMKDDDELVDKQLGFIAQEVKDFIPQAYVQNGDEDYTFIGLNYNAITATLVKAIQELKAEIEELKNK